MDIFDYMEGKNKEQEAPLAARMRPVLWTKLSVRNTS